MYVYNTVVCVCISSFVLMFLDVITIYLFNVYSNQVNVYTNYAIYSRLFICTYEDFVHFNLI